MDIFAEQQESTLSMDLNEIHSELNEQQREAALFIDGPCMVNASAGSGKTKTLIHRVATLIANGIPPTSIMMVTFTNKAAAEIKNRLETMVGEHAQHITAGTFHSVVFQKMIKQFPESKTMRDLGVDVEKSTIFNEDDSKDIMKAAWKTLSPDEKAMAKDADWTARKVMSLMGYERSMGRDAEAFRKTIEPGEEDEVFKNFTYRMWIEYNKGCRLNNGVDFDDVLLFCHQMLKNEPELSEDISRQYRYLMLDEYQDTNRVQMSIMDSVAKYHNNIFVVGDDKQSIYGFRGSDISVILGFKRRYPGAKMIVLDGNYRSKSKILQAANACALAMPSKLTDGQVLGMQKDADVGGKVSIVEFESDDAEADMITRAIIRDINGDEKHAKTKPKQICVLYRQRSLRLKLEEHLVKKKIPYRIVGDRSFFQRLEVRDIVALIRFVFRDWDSIAAKRILKNASLSFSDTKCSDMMMESGKNAWAVIRAESKTTLKNTTKPTKKASILQPYTDLCKSIQNGYEYGDLPHETREGLAMLWDQVLRPGVEAAAQRSTGGDSTAMETRVGHVTHILDRVQSDLEAGLDIDEVIDDLSMMVEADEQYDPNEETKINLMTMHASKGLEFDNVYMMGLNNVTMPTEGVEPEDIEEGRRLFYVGMTRARVQLALSSARRIFMNGAPLKVKTTEYVREVEQGTSFKRIIHQSPKRYSSGPGW